MTRIADGIIPWSEEGKDYTNGYGLSLNDTMNSFTMLYIKYYMVKPYIHLKEFKKRDNMDIAIYEYNYKNESNNVNIQLTGTIPEICVKLYLYSN